MKRQNLLSMNLLFACLALSSLQAQDNKLEPTGNVGVGTLAPTNNFEVIGTARFTGAANGESGTNWTHLPHPNGNNYIRGNTFLQSADQIGFNAKTVSFEGGKVGIGTDDPQTSLDVHQFKGTNRLRVSTRQYAGIASLEVMGGTAGAAYGSDEFHGWVIQHGKDYTDDWLWFRFAGPGRPAVAFRKNGNVQVKGTLTAKELRIRENAGADFVFEEDYNLPSLEEVEKHIKAKKHLPEIAPAAEMKKNGVMVGEFQIQLLQKIEELTLYTIEQEKRIKQLEDQIKN